MREQGIQNLIRIFMSGIGVVNWRNNTGTGWVGKAKNIRTHCTVACEPGDVVIKNARPLRSGLCKGSSDIIGITPVFITQAHIGRTLGVFSAIEVKSKTGKPSADQLNFLRVVEKAGGFAGIARSNDDIEVIINRN